MKTGTLSSPRIFASNKPRVAVVYAPVQAMSKGGREDILSEQSGREDAARICRHLQERGMRAELLAATDDVGDLIARLAAFECDAVFNLAETLLGDSSLESFVPSLMEFLGYPYTGSGPLALQSCLDKARCKEILTAQGIATPGYQVLDEKNAGDFCLDFPVLVKPLREDGSLGIGENSFVRDMAGLRERVAAIAQQYHQPALVERYAGDREFNVSVIGNAPPVALPVCEIDYALMPRRLPKILTFKAKWHADSEEYRGSLPVCPAPITGHLLEQVENTALAAYSACGLQDYGRVDLRWDGVHAPAVIDVNPNPALSPNAGFVLSAEQGRLEYGALIEKIAHFALARKLSLRGGVADEAIS